MRIAAVAYVLSALLFGALAVGTGCGSAAGEGTLRVSWELRGPGGEVLSCAGAGVATIALQAFARVDDALPAQSGDASCLVDDEGVGAVEFNLPAERFRRVVVSLLGADGRPVPLRSGAEARFEYTFVEVPSAGLTELVPLIQVTLDPVTP